jgi:hypothetical protein
MRRTKDSPGSFDEPAAGRVADEMVHAFLDATH